jgi:uncharacterized protein (TIRG00374 family)
MKRSDKCCPDYWQALRLLLLVLSLTYLAYFFWKERDNINLAFSFGYEVLSLIIMLQFTNHLTLTVRYQIILEKVAERSIAFRPWFRIFAIGRFLNTLIPQSGILYRSIALKEEFGISYTGFIAAFASFAWLDVILSFSIALMVLLLTSPSSIPDLAVLRAAVSLILIVLIITPSLFLILSSRIPFTSSKLLWAKSKMEEVLKLTLSSVKDYRYLVSSFALGFASFIQVCMVFYLCFSALSYSSTLVGAVVFCSMYRLSSYVQITPGNLGIQELAFALVAAFTGISFVQAVIVSAILRVTGFFMIFVLGGVTGGFRAIRHKEEEKEESQAY